MGMVDNRRVRKVSIRTQDGGIFVAAVTYIGLVCQNSFHQDVVFSAGHVELELKVGPGVRAMLPGGLSLKY